MHRSANIEQTTLKHLAAAASLINSDEPLSFAHS
jgi:hypothetical protein